MDTITGIQIYYYYVCKRKMWFFVKDLKMEDNDENVILGKIIDENSYIREEKHLNINNVINIDFIKGDTLYETKKSKCIENASTMQVKYYLYYLEKRGLCGFKAVINYPEIKEKVNVELTESDKMELDIVCREIEEIKNSKLPPSVKKKGICKKCAYFDLCMI